jgi:hypothetical protein
MKVEKLYLNLFGFRGLTSQIQEIKGRKGSGLTLTYTELH